MYKTHHFIVDIMNIPKKKFIIKSCSANEHCLHLFNLSYVLSIRTYTTTIFEVVSMFSRSTYNQPYFEHLPTHHLYSLLLPCIAPSPAHHPTTKPLLFLHLSIPRSRFRIRDIGQSTTSLPNRLNNSTSCLTLSFMAASSSSTFWYAVHKVVEVVVFQEEEYKYYCKCMSTY